MAGLYFHIPFCKRICAYCDFYKSVRLEQMDGVTAAMHRELDERQDYLRGEAVTTRYFGGGTPSLYAPAALKGLLNHAAQLFDCSGAAETTLEANPDRPDGGLPSPAARSGHRPAVDRHPVFRRRLPEADEPPPYGAQAIGAVRAAQRAGFGNITADLIFGIPGFGGDSLKRSLDGVLSLGVQHISAYHLTVEPDTAFGRRAARGEFRVVEEEVSEEEFLTVHQTLTAAGFEHYEVSNYALPGFRARHNAAYWHGVKYLGIGPAAHSFDGEERHWNACSVEKYIAGAPAGKEVLTRRDRFNEYVMTALRTAEGIDLEEAAARFGAKRLARMQEEAAPFLRSGTLRIDRGRMALPPEKFLISDAVIGALFET